VSSIPLGKLGLIVDTIWLHEALEMSPGFVESIPYFINEGEIISFLNCILTESTCGIN